jgi:hypothetical protein
MSETTAITRLDMSMMGMRGGCEDLSFDVAKLIGGEIEKWFKQQEKTAKK